MILFRSPRRGGVGRVRVAKPGLSDREIASRLAPQSNDVDFAPITRPYALEGLDDGGPIEPPRDPVVEWHRGGGDAA